MGKLKRRGFSLVELMIGVAILVIAITGMLLTYVHCMLLNEASRSLATATNDAQYVLEHMRSLTYSALAGYTPPAFTNLPAEAISLTRSIGATLATITVTVSWQERQGARSFSITTYIAN